MPRIISYFMNTSNDDVFCHFEGFRYRRFPQLVTIILVSFRHFISPAVKCCYCRYHLLTAIYFFVQTDGLIGFFFLIKPSAYVFQVDMFSLFPFFLSSFPYIILNGFQWKTRSLMPPRRRNKEKLNFIWHSRCYIRVIGPHHSVYSGCFVDNLLLFYFYFFPQN